MFYTSIPPGHSRNTGNFHRILYGGLFSALFQFALFQAGSGQLAILFLFVVLLALGKGRQDLLLNKTIHTLQNIQSTIRLNWYII